MILSQPQDMHSEQLCLLSWKSHAVPKRCHPSHFWRVTLTRSFTVWWRIWKDVKILVINMFSELMRLQEALENVERNVKVHDNDKLVHQIRGGSICFWKYYSHVWPFVFFLSFTYILWKNSMLLTVLSAGDSFTIRK